MMIIKAKCLSRTKSVFILIVLIFFSAQQVIGQTFNPTINPTHWTIDGEARPGYSTDFDMSAKEVEKGWWRYSRSFGRPLNMKTFYKVTIPSEANQGNVDLELLARVIPGKKGSTFFLTVNGSGLPKSKQDDYLAQVKSMLQEFKVSFYLDCLETQLAYEERKAKKLSRKVDRAGERGKDNMLNALAAQEQKLEELREQVKAVYKAY